MTFVRCLTVAAGLGLLAGCSPRNAGAAGDPEVTLLQEVNDLLHAGAGASHRAPARLADLRRFENLYPRGYAAVKSGAVVVLWGAPVQGEGAAGRDERVVAYEKGAPTGGGYALLSAGTVRRMTADEFRAAPKAATK